MIGIRLRLPIPILVAEIGVLVFPFSQFHVVNAVEIAQLRQRKTNPQDDFLENQNRENVKQNAKEKRNIKAGFQDGKLKLNYLLIGEQT